MSKAAGRESVERYRLKMRKAGLRPVQIWLPDIRAPGFKAECRKQSRAAAAAAGGEDHVLTWISEVQDTTGWTA